MSDKYDQLAKTQKLLDQGTITEEEFQAEKSRILGDSPGSRPSPDGEHKPWGMEENTFCMLLHLSQFLGFFIPLAGLILPIVMWATEKNNSETIDAHGKNLLNFFISYLIYFVVSIVLAMVVVGFVLLAVLFVLAIVFPIIAAVKANQGTVWKYPLCIQFFSVSTARS